MMPPVPVGAAKLENPPKGRLVPSPPLNPLPNPFPVLPPNSGGRAEAKDDEAPKPEPEPNPELEANPKPDCTLVSEAPNPTLGLAVEPAAPKGEFSDLANADIPDEANADGTVCVSLSASDFGASTLSSFGSLDEPKVPNGEMADLLPNPEIEGACEMLA